MMQLHVEFHDAEDFAKFIGEQTAFTERFVMEAPEYHRQNNSYHDAFNYKALLRIDEVFFLATLNMERHFPPEWNTRRGNGKLSRSFSAKSEVVHFLRQIGVADGEVAKINKISVSTIREIIDSSPTKQTKKDETFEEITRRLRQKGDSVELMSKKYGKINLRFTKHDHHRDLHYVCEADWSKQLKKLTKAVTDVFAKHKIRVVRGNVNLRG